MNIIFVISSPFPYGSAYSSRAINLTKLFCTCGYHVHVIAPKSKLVQECKELEGFDYSVEYVVDTKNVLTLCGIGTDKPYMDAVNKYLKEEKIDLIISSSMVFVADKLYKLSKKIDVPYIIEQCEWYDESTFKFGRYNPYFREHIKRIEKKNQKLDGVISISTLFEKHYLNQGVKTVRIPTILDVQNTEYRTKTDKINAYKIAFAGSLGKGKENLKPVLEALKVINKNKIQIIFDIYGPSEKQLLSNINDDIELWNTVKNCVHVHGYIPQNQVPKAIYDSDFTIFFRPDRKSSNAGFPTKLAESMTVGTPVITNNTGDISLYVKNGVNGYICNDSTSMEIESIFEKILNMDIEKYMQLRVSARKTAEESFDYKHYINAFNNLLKEI